jgi:chemotaxis protein methyltransferase CheR
MLKVSKEEYVLMKRFIEDKCGIHLEEGKEYLIESRLSDLVLETGCESFTEFHLKAKMDTAGKLACRIIDAMTTNETLWFRDQSTWKYIKEVAIPQVLDQAEKKGRARIWSAAASTGQEAYSLIMLLDEATKARNNPSLMNAVEIVGTDISSSALFLAKSGRYDTIAMGRGLPIDKKSKYFTKDERVWIFDQELKKRVSFKRFNLKESFMPLGMFDLILCRYVIIYFSDDFKRDIYKKLYSALQPGSTLLLGATESLRGYSSDFDISYFNNSVIFTKT